MWLILPDWRITPEQAPASALLTTLLYFEDDPDAWNSTLRQLLDWGVENIQEYGRVLGAPLISHFQEKGVPLDDEFHRAHHLMGLQLPDATNSKDLVEELREIYVSLQAKPDLH